MLVVHQTAEEVNGSVEEPTQGGGRAPYFKLFVDDWRAGTTELTYEQKGLYIDLLCLIWDRKGDLPADTDELAKMLHRDRRNVRRLVGELITAKKLREVRGKLVNGRMSKLIMEQQQQSEIASKSRRSRGEVSEKSPRSLPKRDTKSEVKQELTLNLPEPEPKPDPDKKDERSKDLLSSCDDAHAPKAKRRKPEIEVDALAAFNAYNEMALRVGIPQANTLTPQRRKSIGARIREHGGMAAWTKALANVEASSFLRGGGPRGWTATLNFLLQASSFAKVLDGGFADRTPVNATGIAPVSVKKAQALAAYEEMFG